MIPTVPFDILVSFAVGQLIAFAAAPDIETRKLEPTGPYLKYALFFGVGCLAPMGFALFSLWPDWSLMYLAAGGVELAFEGWPGLWSVMPWVVAVSYVLAAVMGYVQTHRWILDGREGTGNKVLGLCVVLLIALCAWGWDRLLHVGTFGPWFNGRAPAVWHTPLFAILWAIGPLFGCTVLFLVSRVRAEARASLPMTRS